MLSGVDLPELLASVHLGFILVYSAQRAASLSVLKELLPKLPDVPKMLVAVAGSDLKSSKLVEEGEELAKKQDIAIFRNITPELPSGFAFPEFFYFIDLFRIVMSRRLSELCD